MEIILSCLGMTALGEMGRDAEGVRLVWTRAFHPWLLLELDGRARSLYVATFSVVWADGARRPDFSSYRVLEEDLRELSVESIETLFSRLDAEGVWRWPEDVLEGLLREQVRDGSEWYLEAWRADGRRLRLYRYSPEPGPFREMALRLVQLAEIPLTPEQIY